MPSGRGSESAACVLPASCDPKTAASDPGASAGAYDAAFVAAAIAGRPAVPEPACTSIAMLAVPAPFSDAVIVPGPCTRREAGIERVAAANPGAAGERRRA